MVIQKERCELRGMSRESLFTLVANQRISNCLVGAKLCGYSLHYKGIHFCISELMGKGCLVEGLEQGDQLSPEKEAINRLFPIFEKSETELLSSEKKPIEFKVYYRDDATGSMVYLGTVVERRRKDRGSSLQDLLKKAIREYSDYVENSSKIFLLGN